MRRNPRAGARKSGGFRLEVFTDDELNEIHLATLEVLAGTGVYVEDTEVQSAGLTWRKVGCDCDPEVLGNAMRADEDVAPDRLGHMHLDTCVSLYERTAG